MSGQALERLFIRKTAVSAHAPGSVRRRALGALLLPGGLLLGACSPLALLDGLVPGDDHRFDGGVRYGGAPRQLLDVYRPLADAQSADARPPLVVFFYGGTWSSGERADWRFVGQALAARGAVVVLPDYRLAPRFTYPVFVQDSAAAVAWALAHAAELGADPRRVFVMGHSAGAYNAAMVALDARWLREQGTSPARLAGWIGLAGPYDFLPIDNPEAQVAFDWPATRADSQPIAHASAASPPALLLTGARDETVRPRRNTLQMAAKLRAAGVPVRDVVFDGLGHVGLVLALAGPLHWLGGPVLPPILDFLQLPQHDAR